MKILFYQYGNICEPDIILEFEKIGFEVTTVTEEITNKKITDEQRIILLNPELEKGDYLFVFSINFFPAISNLCNLYGKPYVTWVVDAPVPELFSKAIANPCNLVFGFDRKECEEVSRYNVDHILHLPLGTNVERWDRVNASITEEDRKKYSADISFVGSLYTEKDLFAGMQPSEYLKGFTEGLYQMQSRLWGLNIIHQSVTKEVIDEICLKNSRYMLPAEAFISDINSYVATRRILDFHISSRERIDLLSKLSEEFDVNIYTRSECDSLKEIEGAHFKGGVATLTEMPKVFNLSKINLNITLRSIETGASLRIWDILGCGGFLLTNYQEEIAEYLVAGEEYDYFSSAEELLDKCRFYLENDDIRRKIASKGYETVKKYHTYTNRMPIIFGNITNIFG